MQTEQFRLHADIEERHWWFVARRAIMRRLVLRLLPRSRRTLVADIGCGTGANIAALAQDYRCVGIDASEEAIALARQRFPAAQFLVGRAPVDLGHLMSEARLLLLMDVLEHVPDDFELLSRLLAAASPGSLMLLTVPADESLWSKHDESFGHYRRYDQKRLARLWSGLPVATRLVSYFSARTYPLIRAVRLWNRCRGRVAGQAGTDFWLPSPRVNRLLTRFFAGEGKVLEDLLLGQHCRGYQAGSSLMAILERQQGGLAARNRPTDVPPDRRRAGKVCPVLPPKGSEAATT